METGDRVISYGDEIIGKETALHRHSLLYCSANNLCAAVLEQLMAPEVLKKHTALCATRTFITVEAFAVLGSYAT